MSLLKYTQLSIAPDLNQELLTVFREQKEILEKLPVLMLASIHSLEDLMLWFDHIEQEKIQTDCIDADTAKFILNRIVAECKEENVLKAIIDRINYSNSFEIILIVSVGRLMLYLSQKGRYEECRALYEKYKDLANTEIGLIVINNALACFYYDKNDVDKTLLKWEVVCKDNALSVALEEIMFAKTTSSSIFSERGDMHSAVVCIESVVNHDAFTSVLH